MAPGDGLRADHHWPPPRSREKEGFYKKFPGRDVAVKELTLNPPTENSKGLRIGNFVQIRDVVDEELESVWSGKKDAKAALDEAVKRGNELLKRFEAREQVELARHRHSPQSAPRWGEAGEGARRA